MVRQYGQTVPAYSFVGDGTINSNLNDSDYLDVLIARGYEKEVIQAVHDHLAVDLDHGAVLLLNDVAAATPAGFASRPTTAAADANQVVFQFDNVPAGTLFPSRFLKYSV